MALKQIEKTINGNRYVIRSLPARASTKLLVKCAPIMGTLSECFARESFAPLTGIDSDKFGNNLDEIILAFAAQCDVQLKGGNTVVGLADIFDVHFSGDALLEMWEWLYACIEANWKSFFVGAIAKLPKANGGALTKAKDLISPKDQTPG